MYTGAWGKITLLKCVIFIELYPMSEAYMLLANNLPQTPKYFTPHYFLGKCKITPNELSRLH